MSRPIGLLDRIRSVSAKARRSGHLLSLPTETYAVQDAGFTFVVRRLDMVDRKKEDKEEKPADFNPFLPYDRVMFVGDVPPRHVYLLNKFNVVDDHLLIVTRDFEAQSSLLTRADFEALWHALKEIDGVAFYNAGEVAGASQRHKHLQLVPAPIRQGAAQRTPFEDAILACLSAKAAAGVGRVASLPYVHAVSGLEGCDGAEVSDAARLTFSRYLELLKALEEQLAFGGPPGSDDVPSPPKAAANEPLDGRQPFAYNLLVTRQWMMLVPRRKEFAAVGMSVNSLGFAGALLVKSDAQLEELKSCGPMNVLREVAFGDDDRA